MVRGAEGTYPIKDKRSKAELWRMLRWEVRSASSLTQEGQWQSMKIAPAESLQDDGGTTLRDQGQRTPSK